MNFVNRLLGQSSGTVDRSHSSGDMSLGLTHLKKLFADFRSPPPNCTQKMLEDKLYNMLPLFCRIFGPLPSSEMTEKFGDILLFCNHVCRLLVSEIRKRASNQSTADASCAITKFLEISSSEEASNGWMLLSTVNLLSGGPISLIDCMTAASLPSTLVKCLYLFFDLPPIDNPDIHLPGCEYSPREQRVLLQKVFTQILVRLCSHVSPAEELSRKDDLTLLFMAVTSYCPAYNAPWRKSAGDVLTTLSRHGLTPNVVHYLHTKGCLAQCLENMQRLHDLSPLELVEMFVSVFCFLKDSSDTCQTLLDDFRSSQGYNFLTDFLLRMEREISEDAVQALRNLILMIASLTTCGFIELKPSNAAIGSPFNIPGFSIPQPQGKGVSVRNLPAFQILQTVFLKATSASLLSVILDVINSIYHQDDANYFILESQNTLSQFAEKIHTKPPDVQQKFFETIEFVVNHLCYVPCKELISLSILIKTNSNVSCSLLCMKSLINILKYHDVFRDVYREVGLLEVGVTCMHRYAALLKDLHANTNNSSPVSNVYIELNVKSEQESELGRLSLDMLCQLLISNVSNAGIFRECGGARCASNMICYEECEVEVLSILHQLVLTTGSDEDMGSLLGLMHTAQLHDLHLKTLVLKTVLAVVRDSHRARTAFRKVGGFVYVMSVLVSMEGCFATPPKSPWNKVPRAEVIILLRTVFATITIAMRFEPANARYFAAEVRFSSLTDAVRLLGCFSQQTHIQPFSGSPFNNDLLQDDLLVLSDVDLDLITSSQPDVLSHVRLVTRCLEDMALDSYDNKKKITSSPQQRAFPSERNSLRIQKRSSMNSIALGQIVSEPLIVHPGAVMALLHLVPSLHSVDNQQQIVSMQYALCELIKSLMRGERNQQVMCEAGLPHELLTRCQVALADELHPLHTPLQFIFERLAAQSLTPRDLRDYLRLCQPLRCMAEDEMLFDAKRKMDLSVVGPTYAVMSPTASSPTNANHKLRTIGGPLPLTQVKCLVSMTTPRDSRFHSTSITPSFVEFDMSIEGFGSLYLPSIAPQGPTTPSMVTASMMMTANTENNVIGGIGTGERIFPPQSGITFSTWLCVDRYGIGENHPVRLLTIYRSLQGRDDSFACLTIFLSTLDKCLCVSTTEIPMTAAGTVSDVDPEVGLMESCLRYPCEERIIEGQWCHITVSLGRSGLMKTNSVCCYVNGQMVPPSTGNQKLNYICPNVGGVMPSATSSVTVIVSASIGTLPQLRRHSQLLWRLGSTFLYEEPLALSVVKAIHALGPSYVGMYHTLAADEAVGYVMAEEKVTFSVLPHTMSQMTLARLRKVYSRTDARSVATLLGMSTKENSTPIRILHNAASHLHGPARSLGAVVVGYLGIRAFCPKPVAKVIMNVGGPSAMLGLVAMATDVESMYAAVKALVCVVHSNRIARREMERTNGYQTLAMLFRKKCHLLNSHILHLTFALVGTVDSGRETTIIPNKIAFADLLCDLEVWHNAPNNLQRSLYEHFFELLTESSEHQTNLALMQDLGLVSKLLHILRDTSLCYQTIQTIASVLLVLLSTVTNTNSLLRFGQFLVSLLPDQSVNEKPIQLTQHHSDESPSSSSPGDTILSPAVRLLTLRNICLDLLAKLFVMHSKGQLKDAIPDEVVRVLGFDWLMLFLQGHLHASTVTLAFKLLVYVLSYPTLLARFREGFGGAWLKDEHRSSQMIDFGLGSRNRPLKQSTSQEVCRIAGFALLPSLLQKHIEIVDLYLLLLGLMFGHPPKPIPEAIKLDVDSVWHFLFDSTTSAIVPPTKGVQLEVCIEGAICLLTMTRGMLNQAWQNESEGSWLLERPVAIVHVLMSLYQHRSEMRTACMTGDFISALVSTLFPLTKSASELEADIASPDDSKSFTDTVVVVTMSDSGLTTHPARRNVLEFLRLIVLDALAFQAPNKVPIHIVDQLLESSPEVASRAQQCEFQTEIIHLLMNHLTGADVLLGEQSAVPLWPGSSHNNLAANVFYLTARIVDCLWLDYYKRDPKEVFDFILQLLNQAKKRSSGISLTLDPLFRCWNRTVLYQLSRPVKAPRDKNVLLDILQVLLANRNLIFGPGNVDEEFVGCLTYCLVQFTDNVANISSPPALRRTTWHVETSEDVSMTTVQTDIDKQLATVACKLWGELYICKKPTIEEILHVSFPVGENARNGDLFAIRPLLSESSARVWAQYFENERKSVYSQMDRMQSQLQSKLQKVGQGVWRLASRRSKKDIAVKQLVSSVVSLQDVASWTRTHISVIKDLVDSQHRSYLQSDQHREQYLLDEWLKVEGQLVRERGLWGPPVGSELDKWMLDMSEGPFRMRKRMCKNYLFYTHYPYHPPEVASRLTLKGRCAVSTDSKLNYERYGNEQNRGMLELAEASFNSQNYNVIVNDCTATEDTTKSSNGGTPGDCDDKENSSSTDEVFLSTVDGNVSSILSSLRRASRSRTAESENEKAEITEGEIISVSETGTDFEAHLDTTLGSENGAESESLVFTRHFEDGERISFVCRCARIQGLDTVEGILMFGKEHLYIADGFTVLRTKVITATSSLPADQLEPIIPPSSATVAVTTNECLKFAYDDIREIHKRRYLLQPIALEIFSSDGRNVLLAFPKKQRATVHMKLEQAATALINDAKESLAGQRQSAKVEQGTGFINSLIGEKSVTQRWERGEISNFEYLMCLNTLAGRSYNDLMQYPIFPWILADYESEQLDLTEPKTFRDLSKPMGAQTPERLKQFKKRYNDWDDPSGETPPYHYGTHYSSAMIVASYLVRTEPFTQIFLRLQGGHFDLADRMFHSVRDAWLSASCHNMADVKELIPEFFYLPEMLLNANNFDLGTKQSGISLGDIILPTWAKGDPREFIRVHREALECDYVSQHLHEWIDLIFGYKQQGAAAAEAVNVFHHLFYEDNVDFDNIDDPLQKSAIIGFVNNFGQIPSQLFKKPHPQKKLSNRLIDTYFFHQLDVLRPSLQPVKELKAAIGQIVYNDRLLCVEQNKVLIPPSYNRFLTWGFSDMSLRIGSYESERIQLVFEGLDDSEILCAACPNAKTIVTGGTGTVVNVWAIVKTRDRRSLVLKQPLYGHTDTVTCLAASSTYNIVVSGSRDRSCIVWDLCKLVFIRQLRGHAAPVAAVCVNDLTGDIATCAGMYLHLWSINGDEIASINMSSGRTDQILCVAMSQAAEWSNENVILTGSSDGVVRMWSIEYVQISVRNSTSPAVSSAKFSSEGDLTRLASDPDLSSNDPSRLVSGAGDTDLARRDDSDIVQQSVELSSSPDSDSEINWPDVSRTLRSQASVVMVDMLNKQNTDHCLSSTPVTQKVGWSTDNNKGEEAVKLSDSKSEVDESSNEFVIVSQTEAKDAVKSALSSPSLPSYRLREGFRWQRQLVFRSKLTMHTAYERKDNKEPATITALAISKDHKTVFVGDGRGRVWSWSVSDQQKRTVADHWVKDESVFGCVACGVRFTFSERRHHCRNCGQVFCSRCSRYETEINRLHIRKPVRVCQACYNKLKGQQALEAFTHSVDST